MKKFLLVAAFAGTCLIYACGGENKPADSTEPAGNEETTASAANAAGDNPAYDPKRGAGKFTNVEIPATLDATMAASGEKVYNIKCAACHKLTDEKLVGPGWKGVSKKHKAEWVMNFVTNTDEMIDKDPQVQAQLELCMVRMPNQSLSDDNARHIYEFMRKNDGVK